MRASPPRRAVSRRLRPCASRGPSTFTCVDDDDVLTGRRALRTPRALSLSPMPRYPQVTWRGRSPALELERYLDDEVDTEIEPIWLLHVRGLLEDIPSALLIHAAWRERLEAGELAPVDAESQKDDRLRQTVGVLRHVTFASVATRLGVGEFWASVGSKTPRVAQLLEGTLQHRSERFEPLILGIVREGLLYAGAAEGRSHARRSRRSTASSRRSASVSRTSRTRASWPPFPRTKRPAPGSTWRQRSGSKRPERPRGSARSEESINRNSLSSLIRQTQSDLRVVVRREHPLRYAGIITGGSP